ncbi:DUF2007 domain-containing protein [Echinicola marina]|uniref:putative signal transducing protein n=1 Tax=Echinicola marina TaxID=2859768 RepID=UPI001CF67E8F|nr:DUF2007 domain-containing protein [Echinicola marina]UCS94601.1 DUF2007 domain-containing protein [Echinicola marina]
MSLIALKTFDNSVEANLLKTKLESEGIQTFLMDENMVTLNPLLSISVGGIKLMVPEELLEKAVGILNKYNQAPIYDDKGNIVKCPHCESSNIVSETSSFKDGKGILALMLSAIFFVLPLYVRRYHRCLDCNQVFDKHK